MCDDPPAFADCGSYAKDSEECKRIERINQRIEKFEEDLDILFAKIPNQLIPPEDFHLEDLNPKFFDPSKLVWSTEFLARNIDGISRLINCDRVDEMIKALVEFIDTLEHPEKLKKEIEELVESPEPKFQSLGENILKQGVLNKYNWAKELAKKVGIWNKIQKEICSNLCNCSDPFDAFLCKTFLGCC